MNLEGKWKAILIGGAITGLAPFVPVLNLACFVLPLAGALAAVAVYRSSNPSRPLGAQDGIILGALSGAVGTAMFAVVAIPLVLLIGGAAGGLLGRILHGFSGMPHTLRTVLETLFENLGGIVGVLVLFRILGQLALSVVFGILGGLIGVALFRGGSRTS